MTAELVTALNGIATTLNQMNTEDRQAIETAEKMGAISAAQAANLREELEMFPGTKAAHLMLRRRYITPEQLAALTKAMAGGGPTATASSRPGQAGQVAPGLVTQIPLVERRAASSGEETTKAVSGIPGAPSRVLPDIRSGADLNSTVLPRGSSASPVRPSGAAAATADTAKPDMQPAVGPASATLKKVLVSQDSSTIERFPSRSRNPDSSIEIATIRDEIRGRKPDDPNSGSAISVEPLPAADVAAGREELTTLLATARKVGASDLHISVGRRPFVRHNGKLRYLQAAEVTPESSQRLNFSILTSDQRQQAGRDLQLDFGLELPDLGRHRCNIFKQRLGWEGAYRLVGEKIASTDELGLPPSLKRLTEYQQGLILVTGPAGCGKTTTVAALLDHVNATRNDHLITVEDPIEYVIPPKKCHVTQREVGQHTLSFASALRAALRQDPDVISIGEMRDLETTSIAITAAETGHLVFGTLHTNSAIRTVARIMSVYPPSQRAQICVMVAESLRGVISQRLIPRKDGKGLALAVEVLIFTPGVAQLVKEGKMHQIPTAMQGGKKLGMKLMDESVAELFDQGVIDGYQAYLNAENKGPYEKYAVGPVN